MTVGDPMTVVVQDRVPLLREAIASTIDAAIGPGTCTVVATGDAVVAACTADTIDLVILEVARTPWDLQSVLDQIAGTARRIIGVGRVRSWHELRGLAAAPMPRGMSEQQLLRLAGIGRSASEDEPLPTFGSDAPGAKVTERELSVLIRLSNGDSTEEVARRLGLSSRSVRACRERLFKKLGVQSRAQAVAAGIELRLVPPEALR